LIIRTACAELKNNSKQFQEFSAVITDEISEAEFQQQVREYPFVICAQGGGLDPSPKAWFCISNGSIPIIKSSVLDDAYAQLPVARVDEWSKDSLNLEKLHGWIDEFSPYYENTQLRAQTLHKLSLDYWWNNIVKMVI
jgi:methionyl-tRNA formyltransferase